VPRMDHLAKPAPLGKTAWQVMLADLPRYRLGLVD